MVGRLTIQDIKRNCRHSIDYEDKYSFKMQINNKQQNTFLSGTIPSQACISQTGTYRKILDVAKTKLEENSAWLKIDSLFQEVIISSLVKEFKT